MTSLGHSAFIGVQTIPVKGCKTWMDDAAASYESSVTETRAAINLRTSSNVAVIANDDIVFDQSLTVYDAVPTDGGTCIDHGAM